MNSFIKHIRPARTNGFHFNSGVKPNPPFRPVFQVAASREGSDIRILNEPLEGSSLFLVETGEGRTPRPKETVQNLLQV